MSGLKFKSGGSTPKYKGSGTKDACYHKVKARYKTWPSAYGSGSLSRCRKVGAANWGNSKKEDGGIIFKKGGSIFDKESKEGLRGWFGRKNKDSKGQSYSGWADCLSRGPCGGEKAGKKRLCRPTLADCPSKEKVKSIAKKKKMGKPVEWK